MKSILTAFLAVCFCLPLVSCNEEEVNSLKEQNEALQKEVAVHQEQNDKLQSEKDDLNDKLTAATGKVSELEKSLAENATQLESITEERDALQAEAAKIAEAEEKKQKELNKYSHEALGDNPTREQLLALFDAYETIAKDAPDVLENIFEEAVANENTVTREGRTFLKGKFKPYTGWVVEHGLDSDQPQKNRDELPSLYAVNWMQYVIDGKDIGIWYAFGPDLQLHALTVDNGLSTIRTKKWYGPGALSLDVIWKDQDESIHLQEGGNDGALLEVRSWIQENGKLRKCPKTDFKNGNGTYATYNRLGIIETLSSFENGIISTRENYGLDGNLSSRTEYAVGVMKRWTAFASKGFKLLEVAYDVQRRAELLKQHNLSFENIEERHKLRELFKTLYNDRQKLSKLSETHYSSRTGKPTSRTHYKNGVEIREEKFK